jgi:predicted nucleic acid-binding protein
LISSCTYTVLAGSVFVYHHHHHHHHHQEKINSYITKIGQLETATATQQGVSSQEIEGLKRLADLYKRHFEEAAEEVKRLEESSNALKENSGKIINHLREV